MELVDWRIDYVTRESPLPASQTNYGITYTFKKSTSIRENLLHQLIIDLRTKIDTTAKRYVDSATASIETYMLNLLDESINSILKPEYINKISEAVIADVRRNYDKIIEGLKQEIEALKNRR